MASKTEPAVAVNCLCTKVDRKVGAGQGKKRITSNIGNVAKKIGKKESVRKVQRFEFMSCFEFMSRDIRSHLNVAYKQHVGIIWLRACG